MAFMEVQKVYSGGYQPSTIGHDISNFGKTLLDLSAQDKQRAAINADKMMENARYQAEKERQAKLDAANAEVQAQNMLNMKQEYGAKKDSLAMDKLTNEQLGKLISADLQAANGITSTNKVYEDLASKASGMSKKEYDAALGALNAATKDKSFNGSRGMVTDEFLKGTNVGEILKYTDRQKAEDAAIDKDKTNYLRDELKDDKKFNYEVYLKNLEHKQRLGEINLQNSGKASADSDKEDGKLVDLAAGVKYLQEHGVDEKLFMINGIPSEKMVFKLASVELPKKVEAIKSTLSTTISTAPDSMWVKGDISPSKMNKAINDTLGKIPTEGGKYQYMNYMNNWLLSHKANTTAIGAGEGTVNEDAFNKYSDSFYGKVMEPTNRKITEDKIAVKVNSLKNGYTSLLNAFSKDGTISIDEQKRLNKFKVEANKYGITFDK